MWDNKKQISSEHVVNDTHQAQVLVLFADEEIFDNVQRDDKLTEKENAVASSLQLR